MPTPGQEFYVQNGAPRVFQRVIERAFPDYKVIFTQDKSPHLIIKEYYTLTHRTDDAHVPYMGISGEYENLRWKRYRPSGYPFFEITAQQKTKDNFLFIPYIAYGRSNPRALWTMAMDDKKTARLRPRQIAYISSHCTAERNAMFKLLRQRFGDQAIALGKCARTPGYEAAGSYHDLKGIYREYNFGLAMENHDRKGYVTEKIMNVFEGGAIPIYWGDGDLIREFFNPEAFFDIKQYKNFEEAADAIQRLANDPLRLKRMLDAPIFKNNVIPPFLLINEDELSPAEEVILNTMAQKLRRAYDTYVAGKRHRRPYWKALDLSSHFKEKWERLIGTLRIWTST